MIKILLQKLEKVNSETKTGVLVFFITAVVISLHHCYWSYQDGQLIFGLLDTSVASLLLLILSPIAKIELEFNMLQLRMGFE